MRKKIEAYRMNNHAHNFMMCHESEVIELESYTAQLEKTNKKLLREITNNRIIHNSEISELEKKMEEAYQVIREAKEETGNRDLSMFLKSIEQEKS